MRIFSCSNCNRSIFFDNVFCVNCNHTLGFLPDVGSHEALTLGEDGLWRSPRFPDFSYKMCANGANSHQVCNWFVASCDKDDFCVSCRLNKTILNISQPENRQRWATLEASKRRLLYSALMLGLPILNKQYDPQGGLEFEFLSDDGTTKVLTGHDNGLITINSKEADDVAREQERTFFQESYRTLLGTFRHESGHYYWSRLVDNSPHLEPFRELFGDEREDYGQALERHHQNGSPTDWVERGFISYYAQTHPWEDWAETWAHYMHVMDTLETARAFGIRVKSLHDEVELPAAEVVKPAPDFERILEDWVPLTLALNSLNRSMGMHDVYPFVFSQRVIDKLAFIHETVRAYRPIPAPWPESARLMGF